MIYYITGENPPGLIIGVGGSVSGAGVTGVGSAFRISPEKTISIDFLWVFYSQPITLVPETCV